MVAAHAHGSGLQGVALLGRQTLKGTAQFISTQFQLGHAFDVEAIEATGEIEHRLVAALAHVGQDVGHALLDALVGLGRPVQTLLKISVEGRRGGGELENGRHGEAT